MVWIPAPSSFDVFIAEALIKIPLFDVRSPIENPCDV